MFIMPTTRRYIIQWLKNSGKFSFLVVTIVTLGISFQQIPSIQHVLRDVSLLHNGTYGRTMYIVIGSFACAVGFPRQIVCFVGGLAYGLGLGLVLASFVTLVGSSLTFYWARLASRLFQKSISKGPFIEVDRFLSLSPFLTVLTFRLMPVGSAFMLNSVAGLSRIPYLPFLAATFLGSMPQSVVFLLLGGGIKIGHFAYIGIGIGLFILSSVVGGVLMLHWKKQDNKFVQSTRFLPKT